MEKFGIPPVSEVEVTVVTPQGFKPRENDLYLAAQYVTRSAIKPVRDHCPEQEACQADLVQTNYGGEYSDSVDIFSAGCNKSGCPCVLSTTAQPPASIS
jgi:hypothetical protein